ncbi:hypothetical protein [Methanobrevibacter sp.]|uniref:hypothetical protein n=1 Tax=Methanobrevibacter sp. TaxID=66852 RepID=UPI003890167E
MSGEINLLKKRYLLLILIVSLFAISAVSAEEIGNNASIISNDYDSGLIAESDNQNDSYGTFQELQNEINSLDVGGTLNLTRNYKYVNGSTDGIWINKHITIDGQGHTIDGNGKSSIFYIRGSNVVLKNLTLINGQGNYGGGISWYGSNGTIKTVKFYNNNALKEGGAVYINTNFLKIQFCNFTNNKAYDGGAVYSYFTNLNISNSYFESNSVLSDGGAIGYRDGISNIVNSTFRNNLADTGGALYWYDTQLTIANSTFYKNFAWERGGAIHCRGYNSKILNSDFINNTGELAGAISLDSPNCLVNSSKFIR